MLAFSWHNQKRRIGKQVTRKVSQTDIYYVHLCTKNNEINHANCAWIPRSENARFHTKSVAVRLSFHTLQVRKQVFKGGVKFERRSFDYEVHLM